MACILMCTLRAVIPITGIIQLEKVVRHVSLILAEVIIHTTLALEGILVSLTLLVQGSYR